MLIASAVRRCLIGHLNYTAYPQQNSISHSIPSIRPFIARILRHFRAQLRVREPIPQNTLAAIHPECLPPTPPVPARPAQGDRRGSSDGGSNGGGGGDRPTAEEIAGDANGHMTRIRAGIAAKMEGLHVYVPGGGGVWGVLARADGRIVVDHEGEARPAATPWSRDPNP